MPANYPEEIIQHIEHGESLKSRNLKLFSTLPNCALVGDEKTLIIIKMQDMCMKIRE
jgi:hypothetical protein